MHRLSSFLLGLNTITTGKYIYIEDFNLEHTANQMFEKVFQSID